MNDWGPYYRGYQDGRRSVGQGPPVGGGGMGDVLLGLCGLVLTLDLMWIFSLLTRPRILERDWNLFLLWHWELPKVLVFAAVINVVCMALFVGGLILVAAVVVGIGSVIIEIAKLISEAVKERLLSSEKDQVRRALRQEHPVRKIVEVRNKSTF